MLDGTSSGGRRGRRGGTATPSPAPRGRRPRARVRVGALPPGPPPSPFSGTIDPQALQVRRRTRRARSTTRSRRAYRPRPRAPPASRRRPCPGESTRRRRSAGRAAAAGASRRRRGCARRRGSRAVFRDPLETPREGQSLRRGRIDRLPEERLCGGDGEREVRAPGQDGRRGERLPLGLAENDRGAVARDRELLPRDLLPGLAEDVGVLEPDVGEHDDRGAKHVRRVEPPAEAGLDNRRVAALELLQRSRGQRFELGRAEPLRRRPHRATAVRSPRDRCRAARATRTRAGSCTRRRAAPSRGAAPRSSASSSTSRSCRRRGSTGR